MINKSEKIFQALGEASMCWSETPKGEFDSTKAKKIGEQLMKDLGISEKPEEAETETGFINSESKLVAIGFEHNARSTADFTEYQKIVNGVTWAYVTRTAGNDYLTKDGEFVCHVETWSLLNKALDEYKLRD